MSKKSQIVRDFIFILNKTFSSNFTLTKTTEEFNNTWLTFETDLYKMFPSFKKPQAELEKLAKALSKELQTPLKEAKLQFVVNFIHDSVCRLEGTLCIKAPNQNLGAFLLSLHYSSDTFPLSQTFTEIEKLKEFCDSSLLEVEDVCTESITTDLNEYNNLKEKYALFKKNSVVSSMENYLIWKYYPLIK
jgi:hypothetical protein